MKKIIYAVMLLLGLSTPVISCNGGDNQNNKGNVMTNNDASSIETETVVSKENCESVLNRLYNEYVFGNRIDQFGQIVDELFTKKAKQKLINAYDYDCDDVCYAIWELRTRAQDSKNEEEESKIDDIWYCVGNVYEVHYIDMGWKGSTLFLFASENGKVKIDDYVRGEDESAVEFGFSADKTDVVVDNQGNIEGAFIFKDGNNYIVNGQDYGEVPTAGHRIVTYSAENGQGVIYTFRSKVNVRKAPTINSAVITQMSYEEGMCPETFPCLGKEDGWYKISINGKVGYVREDLVEWDFVDRC